MRPALALAPTPARPREPLPHEMVLAFINDADTRQMLETLLEERHVPATSVLDGGIGAALSQLGAADSPKLLIVDVSDSQTPAGDMAALAAITAPETRIIAIGEANDVALFRDLLATGVADYLVKPVSRHVLQAALLDAEGPGGNVDNAPRVGRTAVFLGARGGVGSTSAAVNAAWLMANDLRQKVALIDLDLHFGTVALSLDIDPGRGLREAMERPSRIDSLFIERAMERLGDRLFVLGAEEPLQDELVLDPSAPDILLHELRQKFDWVVVDLPRGATLSQRQVLAAATHVVLVCELSLAGMRDAIRMQAFARDCAPQAKLILLSGGAEDGRKPKISLADFERGLGQKLDYVIPHDAKAATASANAGKPLPVAARSSKVAAALRRLAVDLVGADTGRKSAPFWRRWKS